MSFVEAPVTEHFTGNTSDTAQLLQAHPYLPYQLAAGLAQSGMSGQEKDSTANDVRTAMAGDGNAITNVLDDPVLYKKASPLLAIKQWITGAVGPWPVATDDLSGIQQELVKQKIAPKTLAADGVWTPEWDNYFRQGLQAAAQQTYAGNQPGGTTIGHLFDALKSLNFTEAGDAILGFVKALPGEMRDAVATAAGGGPFGVLGTKLIEQAPGHPFRSDLQQVSAQAYATTAKALGASEATPQLENEWGQNSFAHGLNAISTVLLLTGAFGAASKASAAIGERLAAPTVAELTTGEAGQAGGVIAQTMSRGMTLPGTQEALAEAAATRSPGVIAGVVNKAGALATSSIPARAVTGAAVGAGATAVAGDTNPNDILAGAAVGGTLGAFTGTRAFQNLPVLGRVGPVVGNLADADGLYYKARTLLATPYKFAPVDIAGNVLGRASLLGAETRGVANLNEALTGSTPFTRSIQGEHTFDAMDDAVKNRLGFTLLGLHIAPSLNDLQFLLHPSGATVSSAAGDQVGNLVQAAHNALGDTGFDAAISHATGLSKADNIAALGGDANYIRFWNAKVAKVAASLAAETELSAQDAALGTHAEAMSDWSRNDQMRWLEHDILADPAKLDDAVTKLRAYRGNDAFTIRVKQEMTNSRLDPKAWLMQQGSDFMDASKVVRENVLPFAGTDHLLTASDMPATNEPGGLGLARQDTLSRQDALTAIQGFRGRLDRLNTAAMNDTEPAEAMSTIQRDVDHFYYNEFHGDPLRSPHDTVGKLDELENIARRLATDVHLAPDAPRALQDAVAQIGQSGYKLVQGRDIGWVHQPESPIDVLDGPLTFRRRIAETVGLNPDVLPDMDISQHRQDAIVNAIQDSVDKGDVKLPPWWDAHHVYSYLTSRGTIDATPGRFRGALQAAFRSPNQRTIEDILGAPRSAVAPEEWNRAVNDARWEANAALQLRDIPRQKIIDALTNQGIYEAKTPDSAIAQFEAAKEAGQVAAPLRPFSEQEANVIYRAIVKGSTMPGGNYLLGLSRLEDLFRTSMGFAGNGALQRGIAGGVVGGVAGGVASNWDPKTMAAAAAIGGVGSAAGGDRFGWTLANLPNRIIQLRNEFRFDLSPEFSARRLVKTNAKLALEHVDPTINPLKTMEEAGTLADDRAMLVKAFPELNRVSQRFNMADEGNRYLNEQDVFGWYNHADFQAYAAGQFAKQARAQGISETDIPQWVRQKLIRTTGYGTGDTAGRSALERSMNMVFFPFSFDKTLYRNFGSYLLDEPAQRILVTNALAAYHQFSQDHPNTPGAAAWVDAHLPLLQEAQHLNAFQHGVSLGQVGGINAPLLNLFLPQSWQPSKDALSTLGRFVPALKDFQRIYKETVAQGNIGVDAGQAAWGHFFGPGSPYTADQARTIIGGQTIDASRAGHPAETSAAQLNDAFSLQRAWFEDPQWRAIMDFNNKNAQNPGAQIKFPMSSEWGHFAGLPITKSNVREIIHMMYPTYNPADAATVVIARNEKFKQYLLANNNTDLGKYAQAFSDTVTKFGDAIANDRITPQQASGALHQLRDAAIYLAENDPTFNKLYDKNFRRTLGPLSPLTNSYSDLVNAE